MKERFFKFIKKYHRLIEVFFFYSFASFLIVRKYGNTIPEYAFDLYAANAALLIYLLIDSDNADGTVL